MIDNFALVLAHGLLVLAVLRLLRRDTLDREDTPTDPAPKPSAKPPATSLRSAPRA